MSSLITQPGTVFSFTGDDHNEFLQGQGTADLNGPVGFCRYSLWLDFKGNIMGDGFVLKVSESEMLLISDQTEKISLMEKFDRHIIADDVVIGDHTGDFQLISVPVDEGQVFCDNQEWPYPEKGSFFRNENAILFLGRRLGIGTLQSLVPRNSMDFGPEALMTGEEAELTRIQAGIPAIPADVDGNSLNPLEANITSALSFTKGCYLGQEVVTRVHRLERVSRRLVRMVFSDFRPEKGDFLHGSGKEVGKITSVVKNCDNFVAIGWLKSKIVDGEVALDEGTVFVESLPAS